MGMVAVMKIGLDGYFGNGTRLVDLKVFEMYKNGGGQSLKGFNFYVDIFFIVSTWFDDFRY
jgi:hypothetical protein